VIGAVFSSGISIFHARRVCPYLTISVSAFNPNKVKELCGMGGWVIINQIGAILFHSTALIIVNLLFGANSAGRYAIALQWVILFYTISGLLSSVLTPTILSYYAHGKTDSLITITKSAVKLMGLAMALPIGAVCGFAPQLLTAWVGPEFANMSPLLVLLTIHLPVNLAVLPLFSINVAYNRVRVPGIVTLMMGIGNIALAIVLAHLTNWGYYSVAAAGAMVLTAKNAFFTPWYATKILDAETNTFTRSMIPGVIATILVGISAASISFIFTFSSIIMLFVAGAGISIIYIMVAWSFGLTGFERSLFKRYIPQTLRRLKSWVRM
jgi:membrane protein EpsK